MVGGVNRSPVVLTLAVIAAVVQFGCGSDDHSAGSKARSAASGRIFSSIAEGAELSRPVHWQARVTGVPDYEVASVRFRIDGKVEHVARQAPYQFAGRGNLLLSGTLAPGSHTFAVDASLRDGRRLTAASTANVSKRARGVPRELLGRWTRRVRAADVHRTRAFRRPEDGTPLPVGAWRLGIGPDGVARYVDPTAAHDLTAGQVRFERGGRLVVGNEIPNLQGAQGYFCPDTVGPGDYRWRIDGRKLAVQAVHDRECADRNSFWNGSFTR
jgi:hypothetical protein